MYVRTQLLTRPSIYPNPHLNSGPPNCPTQDGGRGLLWACLRLLKEKERALKQQLLEAEEEGEREEEEGGNGGVGVTGLAARALAAVWNGRW